VACLVCGEEPTFDRAGSSATCLPFLRAANCYGRCPLWLAASILAGCRAIANTDTDLKSRIVKVQTTLVAGPGFEPTHRLRNRTSSGVILANQSHIS